jgi:hypothetical protein
VPVGEIWQPAEEVAQVRILWPKREAMQQDLAMVGFPR